MSDKSMFTKQVKVVCGANTQCFDIAGQTVDAVRQTLTEAMNIPEDAQAIVSGNNVDASYSMQNGDTLEFVRPAGCKG